nr:hypothetical protein BaRGS_031018 [Batillaria attramentaria]
MNYCYLFNNNTNDKVTWDEAGTECATRQGHRGNHWDKEPDNTQWEDCVFISTQGELSVEDCNNRHGYICQIRTDQSGNCPAGDWYGGPSGTMCYYFSNTTYWPNVITWDQSRKTCESWAPFVNDQTRKATMLAITNLDIQTYLASNLAYYEINNQRQVYWTGLNDKTTEATFVWAGNENTQFNQDYIKWRQEPNNLGGHENCGALLPNGEWSDRGCSDKLNFACRLAIPDTPQEWNMGCGQWLRAGRKCVYVYSKPMLTWLDARSFCQQQKGDLMKFDNMDDVNWVKILGLSQLTALSDYWIGLNDRKTENTFLWADGSWADGDLLDWDQEPSNFRPVVGQMTGQQEDCAVMGIDGFFSDRNCRQEHAGAICEEVPTAGCAVGWQTYNGNCYYFDVAWRNRPEARDNCKTKSATGNGRLFALSSQDEKDWLVKQIAALKNAPYYYWSNLNDWSEEDDWHWADADEDDPTNVQNLVGASLLEVEVEVEVEVGGRAHRNMYEWCTRARM